MLPLWFLIIVFVILVLIFILLITNSVILHRQWNSMLPNTTTSERNRIYNLYIWNVVGSVVLGILLLVCIIMIIFFSDEEDEKTKMTPITIPKTTVETKKQVGQPKKGIYKITRYICPECPEVAPLTSPSPSAPLETLVSESTVTPSQPQLISPISQRIQPSNGTGVRIGLPIGGPRV